MSPACSAPNEPAPCTPLPPSHRELRRYETLIAQDFRVDQEWSRLEDRGVLIVLAAPIPGSVALPLTGRIRFRVHTSEGDEEEFDGSNFVCAGTIQCTALAITMQAGADVRDIESVLSCIPARLSHIAPDGRTATLRIFDDRKREDARVYIPTLNGVASVSPIAIDTNDPELGRLILGAVAVDNGVIQVGDKKLHVLPTSTVEITQLPPPGLGLRADETSRTHP